MPTLTKDGVTAVRLDPAFDYPATVESLRGKILHTDERGKIDLLDESAFEAERNALFTGYDARRLHDATISAVTYCVT
jgi:hypothetical protein